MAFFSGDTALEASALARADLSDPQSFAECVNIVKTYTRAKMVKYKSLAPALPGGKLEALEKKYAHLGFQDVFYVTRLELKLPASSVPLPRPTPPVFRRLEAAGYPLPTTFFDGQSDASSPDCYEPPSRAAIARSISGRSRKGSWISEDEFRAGMPLTRETYGFANRTRKANKEVDVLLAAAATANEAHAALASPSTTRLAPSRPPSIPPVPPLPPLPPPPKRPLANAVYLEKGFSADLKPPACGCLDHPSSPSPSHKSALSLDSKYSYLSKLSGDTKEAIRPDSPTIPVSPKVSLKALSEEPQEGGNRDTVDIRALFDALPPEAKAMAVERLEAKRRMEERERAALAAEKRATLQQQEDEERERARILSWERAKARERQQNARRQSRLELETHVEALERQRAKLLATQKRTTEVDTLPGLQGLVDALPTPPPRVDEDARRMIEARIAALQSALNAMGVEPGSPPLPPTPMSSASRSPMRFSDSTISAHTPSSPLPSPIITPHSPFPSMPIHGSRHSKPAPAPHAFDLDEHVDALCRAAEEAQHSQRWERAGSNSRPVVPLTPAGIAAQLGERRSPPPSYTLVEARSFSVDAQARR